MSKFYKNEIKRFQKAISDLEARTDVDIYFKDAQQAVYEQEIQYIKMCQFNDRGKYGI